MAVITAVWTVDALAFMPKYFAGIAFGGVSFEEVVSFKIGEGGWVDEGSGRVPRTPDSSLRLLTGNLVQDLDSVVDPTRPASEQRYATDERFSFEKSFVASDIQIVSPSSLRLSCNLLAGEANNDGFGNDPEFYEIGIFTDHPDFPGVEKLMIGYGTFPLEIKTAAAPLENIVLLSFAGSTAT